VDINSQKDFPTLGDPEPKGKPAGSKWSQPTFDPFSIPKAKQSVEPVKVTKKLDNFPTLPVSSKDPPKEPQRQQPMQQPTKQPVFEPFQQRPQTQQAQQK